MQWCDYVIGAEYDEYVVRYVCSHAAADDEVIPILIEFLIADQSAGPYQGEDPLPGAAAEEVLVLRPEVDWIVEHETGVTVVGGRRQ